MRTFNQLVSPCFTSRLVYQTHHLEVMATVRMSWRTSRLSEASWSFELNFFRIEQADSATRLTSIKTKTVSTNRLVFGFHTGTERFQRIKLFPSHRWAHSRHLKISTDTRCTRWRTSIGPTVQSVHVPELTEIHLYSVQSVCPAARTVVTESYSIALVRSCIVDDMYCRLDDVSVSCRVINALIHELVELFFTAQYTLKDASIACNRWRRLVVDSSES